LYVTVHIEFTIVAYSVFIIHSDAPDRYMLEVEFEDLAKQEDLLTANHAVKRLEFRGDEIHLEGTSRNLQEHSFHYDAGTPRSFLYRQTIDFEERHGKQIDEEDPIIPLITPVKRRLSWKFST